MIGYAMLGEDSWFDWQVLPEYLWIRIETEVMILAEKCLAKLCKQDAQKRGGKLVSGARHDNAKRIVFLEQHSFRYSGEFVEVNMLRYLDEPVPEPVLPTGYTVRTLAKVGEVPDRVATQREVWHPWTVGNISNPVNESGAPHQRYSKCNTPRLFTTG